MFNQENLYGNSFYKILSEELIKRNPNVKGLSQINIRYAERFYTLYKKIVPQIVEQLLLVAWGHHRIIIDKCKSIEKCLFYIKTTIENNLSRYGLESSILANVYERSQNTLDSFSKSAHLIKDRIADQIMKDSFHYHSHSIFASYLIFTASF